MINRFPEYIKDSEAACPCCGAMPKLSFVLKIYAARIIADIPFGFSSFMRCEKHNKKIGGASDSAHLHGVACDIRCTNSKKRFIIVNALMKVGFQFIEVADRHIHVDDHVNEKKRPGGGPRIYWGKSK